MRGSARVCRNLSTKCEGHGLRSVGADTAAELGVKYCADNASGSSIIEPKN